MRQILLSLLATLLFVSDSQAEQNKPLKIGILLPLSGNYSALGEDCRQGVELALEESENRSLLSLVYADSKADPHTAVPEFKKLINVDKAVAGFLIRSPVGMAINPISQNARFPILGAVAVKEFAENNPYAFQVWAPAEEEANFLAEQVLKRELRKVAIITAEDDWLASVSAEFQKRLISSGGEIISLQEISPAEIDFRTFILQLRAKKPEAIFINLGLAQIAPMLRQLREQQIEIPIFSNFWAGKKEVIEAAGKETSNGVMFTEMATDFPQMLTALKKKFDSKPSAATVSAYVATMLLIQAADKLPSSATSEQFYQKLLEQKMVKTANGAFKINERSIQFPLRLREIKNGEIVTIPH